MRRLTKHERLNTCTHLQKFVGEGDLPYEARREAAIKAKAFLTQGSQKQGNGLAKKVTVDGVESLAPS